MRWKDHNSNLRKMLRKYTVYMVVMGILCLLFVLSAALHVFCGSSIAAELLPRCPALQQPVQRIATLVSLEALLKIVETIGLGSLLITWIYASLDKTALGFKYSELLLEIYPGYHGFVLIHIIAILACMWASKTGNTENAVLAFAIVCMGGILQWKTLQNLILFSDRRLRIVADRWNRLMDEDGEDLLVLNYQLATALSFAPDGHHQQMLQIISRSFLKYIQETYRKTGDWTCVLRDTVRIWNHLLSDRSENERNLIFQGVLTHCLWKRGIGMICVGYVLSRYYALLKGQACDMVLFELAEEISVLLKQYFSECRHSIPFYLKSAFTTLAYMHFLNGTAVWDSEFERLMPSEYGTKEDEDYMRAVAQSVFSEKSCDRFLAAAFSYCWPGRG